MVGSRDPDWLQQLMHVPVELFRRYGLAANFTKSCTMTYQPDTLRLGMLEEAKALKCTRGGRLVPGEAPKAYPMPGLWSRAHREVNDGKPPTHARYGACNQLELAAGPPDGAPTPGVQCDLSEGI